MLRVMRCGAPTPGGPCRRRAPAAGRCGLRHAAPAGSSSASLRVCAGGPLDDVFSIDEPATELRDPVGLRPPTVAFGRLWHVGTLNPAEKWANGFSYEGNGLSVSRHPEDWAAIARLGSTTWELDTSTAVFVDYYEVDQREHVTRWAVTEGFLEPARAWRVTYWDEDLEDEVSFLVDSEDDARVEVEERIEWGDEGATWEQVETWAATTALHEAVGYQVPDDLAEEQWFILYVDRHLPNVDGIWWEDAYDPDRLSCPRGVVFQRALERFKCHQVG